MGGKRFLGFGLDKTYDEEALVGLLKLETEDMCAGKTLCIEGRCSPPGLDQGNQTTMVYRLNAARLRRFVLKRLGEHLFPALVGDDSQGHLPSGG